MQPATISFIAEDEAPQDEKVAETQSLGYGGTQSPRASIEFLSVEQWERRKRMQERETMGRTPRSRQTPSPEVENDGNKDEMVFGASEDAPIVVASPPTTSPASRVHSPPMLETLFHESEARSVVPERSEPSWTAVERDVEERKTSGPYGAIPGLEPLFGVEEPPKSVVVRRKKKLVSSPPNKQPAAYTMPTQSPAGFRSDIQRHNPTRVDRPASSGRVRSSSNLSPISPETGNPFTPVRRRPSSATPARRSIQSWSSPPKKPIDTLPTLPSPRRKASADPTPMSRGAKSVSSRRSRATSRTRTSSSVAEPLVPAADPSRLPETCRKAAERLVHHRPASELAAFLSEPASQAAMKRQGIMPEDLEKKSKHSLARGASSPETVKMRVEFYEARRVELVAIILDDRERGTRDMHLKRQRSLRRMHSTEDRVTERIKMHESMRQRAQRAEETRRKAAQLQIAQAERLRANMERRQQQEEEKVEAIRKQRAARARQEGRQLAAKLDAIHQHQKRLQKARKERLRTNIELEEERLERNLQAERERREEERVERLRRIVGPSIAPNVQDMADVERERAIRIAKVRDARKRRAEELRQEAERDAERREAHLEILRREKQRAAENAALARQRKFDEAQRKKRAEAYWREQHRLDLEERMQAVEAREETSDVISVVRRRRKSEEWRDAQNWNAMISPKQEQLSPGPADYFSLDDMDARSQPSSSAGFGPSGPRMMDAIARDAAERPGPGAFREKDPQTPGGSFQHSPDRRSIFDDISRIQSERPGAASYGPAPLPPSPGNFASGSMHSSVQREPFADHKHTPAPGQYQKVHIAPVIRPPAEFDALKTRFRSKTRSIARALTLFARVRRGLLAVSSAAPPSSPENT